MPECRIGGKAPNGTGFVGLRRLSLPPGCQVAVSGDFEDLQMEGWFFLSDLKMFYIDVLDDRH